MLKLPDYKYLLEDDWWLLEDAIARIHGENIHQEGFMTDCCNPDSGEVLFMHPPEVFHQLANVPTMLFPSKYNKLYKDAKKNIAKFKHRLVKQKYIQHDFDDCALVRGGITSLDSFVVKLSYCLLMLCHSSLILRVEPRSGEALNIREHINFTRCLSTKI